MTLFFSSDLILYWTILAVELIFLAMLTTDIRALLPMILRISKSVVSNGRVAWSLAG